MLPLCGATPDGATLVGTCVAGANVDGAEVDGPNVGANVGANVGVTELLALPNAVSATANAERSLIVITSWRRCHLEGSHENLRVATWTFGAAARCFARTK